MNLHDLLTAFMDRVSKDLIDIYNEFSFQHELGIFIKNNIDEDNYKVQFERNVTFFGLNTKEFIKKEIESL